MTDAEKIKAIRNYFRRFHRQLKEEETKLLVKQDDELNVVDYMLLDFLNGIGFETLKKIEKDIKKILRGKEVSVADL